MVNNCTKKVILKIKELGKLINSNFDKVNNIEELINDNKIIGYYDNDVLVGFLSYEQVYEKIDLVYIVVEPINRRKNIGTKLLNYLIQTKEFEKIMLEVRCDNNSAIKLYKKFNFKIINIRENYYNNMDAYVMEMIK